MEEKAGGGGRESIKYGRWGAIIVGFLHTRSCFQRVGAPNINNVYKKKRRNHCCSEPLRESRRETVLFRVWSLFQPPREASARKTSVAHL